MKPVFFFIFFIFLGTGAFADSFTQRINRHDFHARQALMKNINPYDALPGTVLASPSRSNPDYYYHWIRDASLVMQVVLDLYEEEYDPIEKEDYLQRVKEFADLTSIQQSNSGFENLGEPKYNVDGTAFTGPWARPQNDGPALRASVLIRYSNILKNRKEKVSEQLKNAIQKDLQFTLTHWRLPNFDLWEEVLGDHFYTRFVQRKALLDGLAWADELNLVDLSKKCREQSAILEASLEDFKDPHSHTLKVTINRTGGIDYKESLLDTGNVLAILHAYNQDGVYAPTNPWILNTLQALQQKFYDIYPINKNYPQFGTAYGRYPEDRYYNGNPWFLTTFAVAELYYLMANELREAAYLEVDNYNYRFYSWILGEKPEKINIGLWKGKSLQILSEKLVTRGDELLQRGLFHSGQGGSMAEQMNRHTGYMESARDLTWSYASFITAMKARRSYFK